jgi:3-oxoacyl-[acyl-carrier-protein] synthase-3
VRAGGAPATVRVSGVGAYLPERVVTSAEVERLVGEHGGGFRIPSGLVARVSGVGSRRWREPGQQASDLAARAGEQAIADAGLAVGDIDVVIFSAASQDLAEPATANLVQEKLGGLNAHCLDVKNACNSFLNGLDIAHAMVETGRASRVLVTAGEVISPVGDLEIRSVRELESKFAGLTLGDGGGAMVVERAEAGRVSALHRGSFFSDGRFWATSVIDSGGSRTWQARPVLQCDGAELRRLAAKHLPGLVTAALDSVGWKRAEVDAIVPHQVSRALVEDLTETLGFAASQAVLSLDHTGNTAAASIPIALRHALDSGRLGPGARLLLVAGAGGFSAGCVPLVL